ncbi:unnamed protein product [Blepharisma stoltei]|uniref:Uncharacterized protein n=1 Tax=Blepharisma stoltei TaxID=1481888 RepID=A0AAU9ISH7_9CILI|nr:unnamed protein product [Blepharisma stoltei]
MDETKLNELTILENNISFLENVIEELTKDYIDLLKEKAEKINWYLQIKHKKKQLEQDLQELDETLEMINYEENLKFPESELEMMYSALLQEEETASQIYSNKISFWITEEEAWKEKLQNILLKKQQEEKRIQEKTKELENKKQELKIKLKQLQDSHSEEFIRYNRSIRPQFLALEERKSALQKDFEEKEIEFKKKLLELQIRLNQEQEEAIKISEKIDMHYNNNKHGKF